MVRYIKKLGRKIKLLPPPTPSEDVRCMKCEEGFDLGSHRRACWDLCGHIRCMACIIELTDGCDVCAMENLPLTWKEPEPANASNSEELEEEVEEIQVHQKSRRPQVLVLSSVLTKCSDEEDEFPQIARLSLSALPVLECATEPPDHYLQDEEDEDYDIEQEKEEEQVVPENESIPVYDISDDEPEIPLIDLSLDDSDDEIPSESLHNLQLQSATLQHNLKDMKRELLISDSRPRDLQVANITDEELPPTPPSSGVSSPTSEKSIISPTFPDTSSCDTLSDISKENDIGSPRTLRQRPKTHISQDTPGATGFGSHICMYCSSSFVNRRALGHHMRLEHWDVRPFPCDICDWPFVSKRSLQDHMLTHTDERPYACTECDARFNRNYTLKIHLTKIHGVVVKNKRKKYETRNSSISPKKRLPSNNEYESDDVFEPTPIPIPIPIVISDLEMDEQPIDQSISSENILSKSSETDEQKENMDFDDTSDYSQDSDHPPKRRLKFHKSLKRRRVLNKDSSEGKYSCCHCKETFTGKMKLGNHLHDKHADVRPYACDICGWRFAQRNKLNLHRITHTIDRPHKCKQCEATFNRKYSLERHIRIMHLKQPRSSEAAENKPSQKKTASCPYCHREFENREILGSHMQKVHTDRRPHVCNQCKWPFARKKHLVAHMRIHNPERPFCCAMCDNKFNRRFSLERHMDNVHGIRIRLTPAETPQGEEYCPECQSLFDSEKCIKVAYSKCGHVSCMDCVKSAEELGCGQCTTETVSKSLPTVTIVDAEVQTPSGNGISEEKDGRFNFELVSNEDIGNKCLEEDFGRDEMDQTCNLTESNEEIDDSNEARGKRKKGYSCKYCKKNYPEKQELGEHYRYVHSMLRPYPCEECGWPFSSLKDLERHQVIHTKEKPYKCHMCASTFNRKSTRDRHVEKIHLKWKRI